MPTTVHPGQALTVRVEDTKSARAVLQRLTLAGVDGDRMHLDAGEPIEWAPATEREAARTNANDPWTRFGRGYVLGALTGLPIGVIMAFAADAATSNILWATGLLCTLLTGPTGAVLGMLAVSSTTAPAAWDQAGRPDATPAHLVVRPRSMGQAARISAILDRSDFCGPVVATDDPHGLAREQLGNGKEHASSS